MMQMVTCPHPARNVLLSAVWVGLAVGLLEGALLYGLQRAGLATWTMIRDGVDARILIASPLFDVVLFLCFGLLWAAVALVLRGRDVLPWAVGFFALAGFYDLLACTGRLSNLAATLLALGGATQLALRVRRKPENSLSFMRRSLPALATVVVLVIAGVAGWRSMRGNSHARVAADAQPAPRSASPNVLLIVLDSVRADHLGAYGYARATSPNLDGFAREGVVFENAYSSSSWTMPSHASLFTNLYNFQNHVDPWLLGAEFRTLAEVLAENRYDTGGAVGNKQWCTYASGIAQGFHYNAEYFHNIPDAISRTLFGRKAMRRILQLVGVDHDPAKKTADTVNEEILEWLDSLPDARRPFFAFLNYYDPHEPAFPPPPYDGRFAPADVVNQRKPLDTHNALPNPLPEERLKADFDAYDSTIAYVDAQMGALWAELEKRGLAANTLLIITSDHGHSFGEAGIHGHRTSLRREQIHVPLILYGPGHVPGGVRVAAPVSQIHVPATVTDLLALEAGFPGRSLARYWHNPAPTDDPEPVLAELARPRRDMPPEWPITRGDMKTLVTDRWQYIEWAGGSSQIFDFRADPREERDLSNTDEGRRMAAILREQLRRILAGSPDKPTKRAPASSPE